MLHKICRHHVFYLHFCTFWLGGPQSIQISPPAEHQFTRLTKIHTSGSSTWKAKVPSESELAILQNVRTLSIYPRKFSSSTRSTHCHQNSLWLTVITIIIAKSVRQQLALVKVKSKIFKLNTSSGIELIILRKVDFKERMDNFTKRQPLLNTVIESNEELLRKWRRLTTVADKWAKTNPHFPPFAKEVSSL